MVGGDGTYQIMHGGGSLVGTHVDTGIIDRSTRVVTREPTMVIRPSP